MLTAAEHEHRRNKFTGSLAPKVMTLTDPAELNRLARIKAELEPPDPETYQMRAGTHMEPFVRHELELQCGHPITRVGEIVDHPSLSDFCVKLDGYRAHDDAVIEIKFLSAWSKRDDFFPYYFWQVLLAMLCCGASRGVLAVAQGTSPPVEHEVLYDKTCAEALIERGTAFMQCVRTGAEPCPLPAPIPPDRMRVIDIIANPTNWSEELLSYLALYSSTAAAAEIHDEAGAAARKLIPDDVMRVSAGKWQLNRDRRGAIRITATNAKRIAA
jgi:predicted phage-related endonuclease